MRYFIITLVTLVLVGCGGGSDHSVKKESVSNAKMADKDRSTPAEQGGYGFEKIADELGFTTYDWSEEKDKTFFGDPRAKKGGTIHYINGYFPNTMRIHGQNSNLLINNRTISICYEALLDLHPVTLEFIPSLASHWSISKDNMTSDYHSRPS